MLRLPSSNATHIVAANEAREFGKYELVSKLAAGGMAITYRARLKGAAGVTKPVVIKQILPHFADDPEFVEMFVSEARVAAGLTHSNIAQVFDFGEIDGQFFLAMEFVHGQPLSKLLRRVQRAGLASMPLPLALHIASQIADGLDYAHRHVGEDGRAMGLVHRDVSPDNVLISYEGQVKVIDFGIAKATSVVEARTSPGTLKGKYPYFSTEQAQGRQDLDARSDIFAVGVVLYEMLCGRRPYEGELVAVLPRILAGDYAPPSSLNSAVTPELESILYTAMALDREQRYPTAQAFAEALREQLYSAYPRFSPALVSQMLGYLFAEELAAEGRRMEVSPAFQELLAEWQAQSPADPSRQPITAGGAARLPSANSSSRPSLKTPASTGGSSSRPALPRSNTSSSNAGIGARTVSSTSGRRVTSNNGIPRTAAAPRSTLERVPLPTMASPPDMLRAEPSTSVNPPSTAIREAQERHDTPPEVPSAGQPPSKVVDALSPLREAQSRDEAERAERRQRIILLISVPMFGLALVLALLHWAFKKDEVLPSGSLWLTSTPAGASVKLNGRDVVGVTPLVVKGVTLHEANTLILTLPGYRPWTKRFTPTSEAEPPLHVELERLPGDFSPSGATARPGTGASTGPIASTGTTTTTTSTPAPEDAGTPAVEVATPEGTPTQPALDFNVVDYPTRLFVLRTQYNALPLGKYGTASIDLSPGASYSVNTSGSVTLQKGRGGATGTLVYYLEGENVPANEAYGLVGPGSRTIKGARRMHVFLLDDDRDDNTGTIRIHLTQSKWVPPRTFSFDATRDALVLKPEHQLVVRGLNPDALYLLTVRDDYAELRPGAKGRTRRVLCVESRQKSARRNHRFLESGKRFQLTGADTLRCTYPDTEVDDNAGALEVDIVDVTVMSRRERAAALRGSSR
jgi:serine/threonine protein kinase